MSTNNENYSNAKEKPGAGRVEEGFSKLSLTAKNVTERLTTPTGRWKQNSHNNKSIGQTSTAYGLTHNEKVSELRGKKGQLVTTSLTRSTNETENSKTDTKTTPECSNCQKDEKSSKDGKYSKCLTTKAKTTRDLSNGETENTEDAPKRKVPCAGRNQVTPSQMVKPRVPFRTIRRRKSMKLGGERPLVRKKSFLKKGDGAIPRRLLAIQSKSKKTTREFNTGVEEPRRISGALLPAIHSETANVTFYLKKNKTPGNNGTTRRQWNDTNTRSYEALIFSTVFAFSNELKESSDVIHSKLQTLCDSSCQPQLFKKKSHGLNNEWRKNNLELLDNGSREIAGIFCNLRKVETNLKTVDQAVSILLKEKSKRIENINDSPKRKDCKLIQKGLK